MAQAIEGDEVPLGRGIAIPIVIFVVLVLLIAAAGALLFEFQQDRIVSEIRSELATTSQLKAELIAEWRTDRINDAAIIARDPAFAARTERWLSAGAPPGRGAELLAAEMERLLISPRYQGVLLLDLAGSIRLIVGRAVDVSGLAAAAQGVATTLQPRFHPFTRPELENPIRYCLLVPVTPGDQAVGVLAVEIDPYYYLMGMVDPWPIPRRGTDTLLFETGNGGGVRILNHTNETGQLIELDPSANTVATQVASGTYGLVMGRSYTGHEVLAYARPITEGRWLLAAAIDEASVFSTVREAALLTTGAAIALVSLAGLATLVWYRFEVNRYRAHWYEDRLRSELLERHFDYLAKYANDIILLADAETRIIEANDRAVEAYGWPREELIGRLCSELTVQEDTEVDWGQKDATDAVIYETEHRRADGSTFPVEVSARIIEDQGKIYFQEIVRDITERRAYESRLRSLGNLYAALGETGHAVVRSRSREELFRQVCRIAVERGGFAYAGIGRIDYAEKVVRRVAVGGEALDRGAFDVVPYDSPDYSGPMAIAARTGQSVIVNNLFDRTDLAPWFPLARQHGVHALAAFPLTENGAPWGVFSLYAYDIGYFDPQMTDLLERMTGDICFALRTFRQEEQRQRAEQQWRLWALVVEHSADAIFITDPQWRIVSVNPAFSLATGYPADEVIGAPPRMLQPGIHPDEFFAMIHHEIAHADSWKGELWDRRKDNGTYPVRMALTVARGPEGEVMHYIGIFSDISEQKAAEERIQFLAQHDVLTGLPNRILLLDRLEQALAHARRSHGGLGVLFADLDRFKHINDTLGHHVGDLLLKATAERLRSCVRQEDTVSRQGGDEFIIVLSELHDPGDAGNVAGKIVQALSAPFLLGEGIEVHVTPSVGIALWPSDADDAEGLIKNADTAMYFAKESGRGRYQFFVSELNERTRSRIALEERLRHSIAAGDFLLLYQPQINAITGVVDGVEALIRWRRNDELVLPEGFISTAEESGLIIPLGEWALNEACAQLARWQDNPSLPPFSVSVNISPNQFHQPRFCDTVRRAISDSHASPSRLEIEVTEGLLMSEADSSVRMLSRLKSMGVSISVDDFGTGYSSLSYLRRFPLDRLKVDKSFIQNIEHSPPDWAITEAIIALGKTLHLKVTAEGVETEGEYRMLRDRGCDDLQGYYFAHPLPPEQLEQWMLARGAR